MKIEFKEFDEEYINKEATLLTIGNGYLGLRASHEERYRNQDRGFFVRGVFNTAVGSEAAELVNLPDVTKLELRINGEVFSLTQEKILAYERDLNFLTGELTRAIVWQGNNGARFKVTNKRVAGQKNAHQVAFQLMVEPLDDAAELVVKTGINAQVSNGGNQHLVEKDLRVFEEKIIAGEYETLSSQIQLALAVKVNHKAKIVAKNRRIEAETRTTCPVNEKFIFEKIVSIHTSLETEQVFDAAIAEATAVENYEAVAADASCFWQDFWQKHRITVDSVNTFDQQALDFAAYHLEIMAPDDPRFSIGAKGLTGEGYKGHVFWDTEIFILPFFLHNQPKIARQLLEYRYFKLAGAKAKAQENNYQGALFPWESALSGFEETPKFAAINIKTGKRQIISSAVAEHHIVADIAYAVLDYYETTADLDFMEKYGRELLKETALFWLSRGVEQNGKINILDVIGPDEYTEHVDNNAYTNYMAVLNVQAALAFKVGDQKLQDRMRDFLQKIYRPEMNSAGLIPQDDTFLSKPMIDLKKYKEQAGNQLILLDYSRQEVIDRQILKQADLIMLFYLQPHLFSKETMKKNLYYYEDKTIHDSSLSKAIHGIVAARLEEEDWAYEMFRSACLIDLNQEPHSSDEGIHAASLGAIWLATVFGFAGITKGETLEITPRLPSAWQKLHFKFYWQGENLEITVTPQQLQLKKASEQPMSLIVSGEKVILEKELSITKE